METAKPHAEKAWAATEKFAGEVATATKGFADEVADSSKATTKMAMSEAKYRAAQRRLAADKKIFAERLLESMQASMGDASTPVRSAKVLGCLKDGSEPLNVYLEAIARFKNHEDAMKEALADFDEAKRNDPFRVKMHQFEKSMTERFAESYEKCFTPKLQQVVEDTSTEQKKLPPLEQKNSVQVAAATPTAPAAVDTPAKPPFNFPLFGQKVLAK